MKREGYKAGKAAGRARIAGWQGRVRLERDVFDVNTGLALDPKVEEVPLTNLEQRLADVQAEIASLQENEADLLELIADAQLLPSEDPNPEV